MSVRTQQCPGPPPDSVSSSYGKRKREVKWDERQYTALMQLTECFDEAIMRSCFEMASGWDGDVVQRAAYLFHDLYGVGGGGGGRENAGRMCIWLCVVGACAIQEEIDG